MKKRKCDPPAEALRVLILEDNTDDAELIERKLRQDGIMFVSCRADSREAFLSALDNFDPGIILSDYNLPRFDASQAMPLAQEKLPGVPFIVITGSIGEEEAVACLRAGADDYLLKDRLGRLGEAVHQALEKKRLQREKAAAESRLRENEQSFRYLTEASPFGIVLFALSGRWLYANPRFREITGYTLSDVPDGQAWFARAFPDDGERRIAVDAWKRDYPAIHAGESVKRQYRVRVKDGRDRYLTITSTNVGQDKGILVFEDVTQRREAGEALRASEARYRLISENSGDVIWVLNLASQRFTFVSPSVLRLRGYTPEEVLAQSLESVMTPESFRQLAEMLPKRLAAFAAGDDTARIWTNEIDQLRRDGSIVATEVVTTLLPDAAGRVTDVIGVTRDISERKKAEAELRESEARFASMFHSSPMPIALSRLRDNRLTDLNAAWEAMTGYSREEAIGHTPQSMSLWVDPGLRERMIETLRARGQHGPLEFQLRRKDGAVVDALMSADLIELGGEGHLLTIAVDIHERKRMEAALHALSQRNEALLNAIPDIIMEVDTDRIYRWANRAGLEFFGDDAIGRKAAFYFLGEQDTYQRVQPLFNGREDIIYLESWQRRCDGEERLLAWWCQTLKDEAGNVTGALSSARDITESRRSEEMIRASLKEKEVLLKEIHHRVKNNLAVISGLLTLQLDKIADEGLRRVIRESQSRIWTMALIHQTLYQSENLADIDMADYVTTLVGSLFSTYARSGAQPNIDFDLQPLRLTIDQAIPLALIINELVTNSLKHAFSTGRPGDIRVSLRRLPAPDAGRCVMTVIDNGTGLPDGFDMEAQKSLGLKLVAMLATQLGGDLTIENDGGAVFRVAFPEKGKP